MSIRIRSMVCSAAMLAGGILLGGQAAADGERQLLDGCEVGSGGNDIHSLESRYDDQRDQLTVTLRLCADANRKAVYRLHLDHAAPFVGQAAAPSGCTSRADTVLARRPDGHQGPGRSVVQGNQVRFIVPLAALGAAPAAEQPAIALWATATLGEVVDRAPNVEGGDDCRQPRGLTETLVQPRVDTGKLVWISTPFEGTIGSAEDADAACAKEAHAAGLSGAFAAWFSGNHGNNPILDFRPSIGPFSTADGTLVARDIADLVDCTKGPSGTDCLRAPINRDIHGNRVQVLTWTGTTAAGFLASGPRCRNWTSSSGSDSGDGGHVDRLGAGWVTGNVGPCNQIRYLICLQFQGG